MGLKIKLFWGVEYEYQCVLWLVEYFFYVEVLFKFSFQQVVEVLVGVKVVVFVDIGFSYLIVVLDCFNIILFGLMDSGLIGGYGKNQIVVIFE